MQISPETLNHLAELSNFTLSGEEKASLKSDLENIVAYISTLDELNVENVAPTFSVSPLENVFREDKIETAPTSNEGSSNKTEAVPTSREALLALTKTELNNQIKVPKVL